MFFVLLLWFSNPSVKDIDSVLNSFHHAAAQADSHTYFSLLADDAVFIGTDASELWSKSEFEVFCKPYFDAGRGWTYTPGKRDIHIAADGETAWFVELLQNEHYGTCRGTGVLVKTPHAWLIAQYHLTIPLPNGIAKDVVSQIRAFEQSGEEPNQRSN